MASNRWLKRYVPLRAIALACLLTGCAAVRAQISIGAVPAALYDAVSIKPSKGDGRSWSISTRDTVFAATGVSIKSLVSAAYGIRAGLIFGLPAWTNSAYYDINAKITDPDLAKLKEANNQQRQAMLAAMLAERFGIKVHLELKVLPVYDLVVMPDGIRFKENPPRAPATDPAPDEKRQSRGSMNTHNHVLTATAVPLASLATLLSNELDRSVIDRTGLKGEYDLHLAWTPEDRANKGDDNGADASPVIYTALKEQLGLKLVPAKAPVDTLVVDTVRMPEFD